jgi:MFS family permease
MAHDERKDLQFYKFSAYGFLKNLKFFEPFLILFLLSREISYLQIGFLYSLREIAINLLEIPTGIFADVWGRKKTMLASFVSYIMAFLILYMSTSFALLAGAMIFYAFGDACRTGTHKAMIFDYINSKGWGNQKSWYYGMTRSWSQKGSALSALLAGLLILWRGDYAEIFLYSIVPYILDFFLILSYPAYLDKAENHTAHTRGVLLDSFTAMKDRYTRSKVISVSLYAGYFKAVKDYLQPLLQAAALALPFMLSRSEEQRSGLIIGLVYTFIYLLTSWVSGKAGYMNEKFPRTDRFLFVTLLLGALAGLAGGLFYYLDLPWIAAGVFVMLFVIENLRKPAGIAYLGESIGRDILATILSVESQGETLWTALFAMILGSSAHYFSVPIGLGISSLLLVLIALITKERSLLKTRDNLQ